MELLSEGTLSSPVNVLLTTEDNTAVCKTCVDIVIVITIVCIHNVTIGDIHVA